MEKFELNIEENINYNKAIDLARKGYVIYRRSWGDGILMFSKGGYTIDKETFANDKTIPDKLKSMLEPKSEINYATSFYLYVEHNHMFWPLGINAEGLGKGDKEAIDWIAVK